MKLLRHGPAGAEKEEQERLAARESEARRLRCEQTLRDSRARDADIEAPCPEGVSYLPYQRAAIAFGLARRNVLFADEMGLGKTLQAIALLGPTVDPPGQPSSRGLGLS